jgi:hypothetical protein
MVPFGHFAIGLLCGAIMMLPFLRDRSLYDYDKQKWVSIEWIRYNHTQKTHTVRKLITAEGLEEDSITNELNPITKSKFTLFTPFVAILCGLFALLPDISHIWGDSSLDKTQLADLFFFHRTLDQMYASSEFLVSNSALSEMLVVSMSLMIIFSLMAISNNFQYNYKNFENVVV